MTIFTDKVKQYNGRFMADTGTTEVQASGVWGNIGGETGGFKYLQEIKPVVAGSKGGYGWQQWTGPRRKQYMAYCTAQKLDPASDEANYRFLIHELKTTEAHSLSQLKKTTTIEAATETYMAQNLRPGVKHLDARINWAKQAYNAIQEQKKTTTQAVVVGGTAVTGGAVAAASDSTQWQWLFDHPFISVSVAVVAIYAIVKTISWFFNRKKEEVSAVVPTARQKGNKNG